MKNTHRKLTITQPEKWHLKYTDRRKHYHQFHSSRWGDSVYLSLNSDEKVVLDWILSQSLMQNSDTLSIVLDHACVILSISLDTFKQSLSTLNSLNIIDLEKLVRSQYKEKNRREENRSKKENKNNSNELCHSLVDSWNNTASKKSLPTIKIINATRKKKILKALKEIPNIDDWVKIFQVAATKGFTKPDGDFFKPNFDYVFRNDNYIKFLEESESINIKESFTDKDITPEEWLKSIGVDHE